MCWVCVLGGEGENGRGETRSFQNPEAGESLFYEYLLTDKGNYQFVTFIMLYIPQLNLKFSYCFPDEVIGRYSHCSLCIFDLFSTNFI